MDENFIEIRDGNKTVRLSFNDSEWLFNRMGGKEFVKSLLHDALHKYYAQDHEKYRLDYHDLYRKYQFLLAHTDRSTINEMETEFEKENI